jgi:hypothetical protein
MVTAHSDCQGSYDDEKSHRSASGQTRIEDIAGHQALSAVFEHLGGESSDEWLRVKKLELLV